MQRFGRYLLLERIARGGMAEVYRAAAFGTAGFARQVAIKMLLPEYEQDPTFTSMLVEEAKIAAELQHPNVIKVVDLGEQAGRHFIVMDFITGQPVSSIILAAARKQMRLPLPFCVYVARQALEGLRYAHQKKDPMGFPMRIIHRDVSPQNVMVTYEGGVCLLDFGIAKAAASAARTRAGVLRGKTGYISPEVVRGAPVTQAMDLYALGVVMHEMVAMRRMRSPRNDGAAIEEASRGAFAKFDELGLEVPGPLASAIYRALAPEEEERFEDAVGFAAALDEVMRALGWSWGSQQTTDLLQMLFPDEIKAEQEATAKFHPLVRDAARTDSAAQIPAVAPPPAVLPSPAATAQVPPPSVLPPAPQWPAVTNGTDPTPVQAPLVPAPAATAPAATAPAATAPAATAPAATAPAATAPVMPPPAVSPASVPATEPLWGGNVGSVGADAPPAAVAPVASPAPPAAAQPAAPSPVAADPPAPVASPPTQEPAPLPPPGDTGPMPFGVPTTQAWMASAPRDDSMDNIPLPRDRPWIIPAAGIGAAALVGVLLAVFNNSAPTADVPVPTPPPASTADPPPPTAPAGDKATPVAPAADVNKGDNTPPRAAEKPQDARPAMGRLNVSTSVPARVWVDGRDTGLVTPVKDLEVAPGAHKLKLVGVKSRKAVNVSVKVTAGQAVSVSKKIR